MGTKAPLVIETAAECGKCGHHLDIKKADAFLSHGSEFLPEQGGKADWWRGTQINVSGVRLVVEPCEVCMRAAHNAAICKGFTQGIEKGREDNGE
jgi:hypothetical protein